MLGTTREERIHDVYRRLVDAFGPQGWWPAETPFEMIVGAILTQNTSWQNASKAIAQLKAHQLLEPNALAQVTDSALGQWIRSAGYYNQKAKRLKIFCTHLLTHWQGDLASFLGQDMDVLRRELLTIKGIGPETADSIILYAAHQPSFVVDAYTHRIFSRHGWVPERIDYEELRSFFMDVLEPDVAFFQELHALIVRLGKQHCRRKPACRACPLEPLLESE